MGKVQVRYEFAADEPGKPATGGRGRLFINGQQVGENHMERTVPLRFTAYAGLDIGKDNGEPVAPTYRAKSPFPFTGTIGRVVFDLAPR
jgi:arylsulfatase